MSWRRFPDLPRKRGVTGNVKQDPRALSRIHSNGTGRCEFCSFQHWPSVSIAYILNLSRVATTSARKAARQVALSTGASGAFLIVFTPSLFKHHNCDDNKDSTHSSDGDGEGEVVVADVVVADVDRDADGETRGEDEEETPQTISLTQAKAPSSAPDRHSLRAASESDQSGSAGGTGDDPVGPITPSAAAGPTATVPHNNDKPAAVEFSSLSFNGPRRRRVGTTYASRICPTHHPPPTAFPPPIIAMSRKRNEPRRSCTVPVERGGMCAGGQATAYPTDEHGGWKRWRKDAERWH